MEDTLVLHWKPNSKNKQKHHFLLPQSSFRAIIVGPSQCGKTNLLFKLLLTDKWLDFNNLYIYGKSLHQPEYKLLRAALSRGYDKESILNLLKNNDGQDIDRYIKKKLPSLGQPHINIQTFEDSENIPDPKCLNSSKKNLLVFDDVMLDNKQSKAEDFYTRGRHNNCSCIYISQNYYKLPRQTIRANANILLLFKLPINDLKHIYNDIVSNDMTWKEFNQFFTEAFSKPHSFIVINREKTIEEGKYQINLNKIYIPETFFAYKNELVL